MAHIEASRLRAAGALSCLILAACSSSQPAPASGSPKAARGGVMRYLPLEDDTVFRFETANEGGDRGILVLQVRRPRPGIAELDIAGRVQRLLVSERAVEHVAGGYVLLGPLTVGKQFQGAFGTVEITRVGVVHQVPAGRYPDCIETVEGRLSPLKRVASTYCAGVGLVSMHLEGETEAGYAEERYRLLSHGKRVDLMQ